MSDQSPPPQEGSAPSAEGTTSPAPATEQPQDSSSTATDAPQATDATPPPPPPPSDANAAERKEATEPNPDAEPMSPPNVDSAPAPAPAGADADATGTSEQDQQQHPEEETAPQQQQQQPPEATENQQQPNDGERHVRFDSEVRLASLVFHEEPIDETPLEVTERLYQAGVAKQENQRKIEEDRKAREAVTEGDPDLTFTPAISTAAKNLPSHRTFDEFLEAREEKTKYKAKVWEKKKTKHESDAVEDVTFKPQLGKRSAKLVAKMKEEKRYKDPIRGWRNHFEHFVLKDAAASGSPPRGGAAAGTAADGYSSSSLGGTQKVSSAVFEKLYRESEMRAAAQQIMAQAQQGDTIGMFQPDRTYTTESGYSFRDETSCRHPDQIVESLLEKGENSKRKIEEQRRLIEAQEYTFTPKTNKLSQKMVQQWSERRMTSPPNRSQSYSTTNTTGLSPDIKGVPVKPRAKFDVDVFCSRISRQAAEREAKLQAMKEAKEQDALEECSFRPRTSDSMSRFSSYNNSVAGTPRSVGTNRSVTKSPNASVRRTGGGDFGGTPRTARDSASRGGGGNVSANRAARNRSQPNSQPQGRPYVVDMVRVPARKGGGSNPNPGANSSSPPTARTFLDDDGETDLNHLEEELRGVIAEWSNIDSI